MTSTVNNLGFEVSSYLYLLFIYFTLDKCNGDVSCISHSSEWNDLDCLRQQFINDCNWKSYMSSTRKMIDCKLHLIA